MTATQPELLEVTLLICPECRRPSCINATAYRGTKGKAYCHGPIGEGHRTVKCTPVLFREVTS